MSKLDCGLQNWWPSGPYRIQWLWDWSSRKIIVYDRGRSSSFLARVPKRGTTRRLRRWDSICPLHSPRLWFGIMMERFNHETRRAREEDGSIPQCRIGTVPRDIPQAAERACWGGKNKSLSGYVSEHKHTPPWGCLKCKDHSQEGPRFTEIWAIMSLELHLPWERWYGALMDTIKQGACPRAKVHISFPADGSIIHSMSIIFPCLCPLEKYDLWKPL